MDPSSSIGSLTPGDVTDTSQGVSENQLPSFTEHENDRITESEKDVDLGTIVDTSNDDPLEPFLVEDAPFYTKNDNDDMEKQPPSMDKNLEQSTLLVDENSVEPTQPEETDSTLAQQGSDPLVGINLNPLVLKPDQSDLLVGEINASLDQGNKPLSGQDNTPSWNDSGSDSIRVKEDAGNEAKRVNDEAVASSANQGHEQPIDSFVNISDQPDTEGERQPNNFQDVATNVDAPLSARPSSDDYSEPSSDVPKGAKNVTELLLDGSPAKQETQPSLGAQILMNRFSSWRQQANQTVTRNAQAVLKSNVAQNIATRANSSIFSGPRKEETDDRVISNVSSSSSLDSSGSSEGGLDRLSTSAEDGEIEIQIDEENQSVSTTGTSPEEEKKENPLPPAAVAVKVAATVVVDSVANGFRGRYSGATAPTPATVKPSKRVEATQSQTALILQSRAASYMQSILDSLEPNEYVMLLGNGMLGVNLKQTFLKNHGVYMDHLVRGGAADTSGVIAVGDCLVKVGETDVRRVTILQVPRTIAAAKRPVVLVFSTGICVSHERMNYIDVAVGMMYKIREEKASRRDISSMPLRNAAEESNGERADERVEQSGPTTEEWSIPVPSFRGRNPMNLAIIPKATWDELSPYIGKRCNENASVSILYQAAKVDLNFRAALMNAFVTCAFDGRRLPFLSEHFASEESNESAQSINSASSQNNTPSIQLMLFLELLSFLEFYGIASDSKRRALAKKIAFKFFLPSKAGRNLEPPMFDFHHMVPDSDLRALENAINDSTHPIPSDLFIPFQTAIMNSLSGPPFLTFLLSDDCARMRGYLRNTAPFVTVSPTDVFDTITAGSNTGLAENHFLYMLTHLICKLEKEEGGEHDGLIAEPSERVASAAGGVACALFIKRHLSRHLNDVMTLLNSHEEGGSDLALAQDALIQAFEHLWEVYLAPGGGLLDSMSNSNATDDALLSVRQLVQDAAAIRGEDESRPNENLINSLVCNSLREELHRLASELLYNYVTNTYPKFKEHKFHEWMCNEVSKGTLEGSDQAMDDQLPRLPTGCIRKLLRKVELPAGVSAHKPVRSSPSSYRENEDVPQPLNFSPGNQQAHSLEHDYPNADFAVVFGTDDGLASSDLIPNPALDRHDIRRYTCQSAVVDDDHRARWLDVMRIPPTLESYATVPSLSSRPFSRLADSTRISADGWEISLVNFMIPTADNTGENALYGVSLVFQRSDDLPLQSLSNITLSVDQQEANSMQTPLRNSSNVPVDAAAFATPTEVIYANGGDAIDVSHFASPIRFLSPEVVAGPERPFAEDPDAQGSNLAIHVSVDTPVFNRYLQETSWSDRIMARRHAGLTEGPVTIGLALVSSQNVVIAMRETLSRMLLDFCRSSAENTESPETQNLGVSEQRFVCDPLVRLLGNFSHHDVESVTLKCILEPYLRFSSSPWLERPPRNQSMEFDIISGQQLIDCLPPIPLALLFVAILLEQKVVFSSSRRSILFSAVMSVTKLLKPLQWCHLLVPLVPSALTRDLLQYPAPFILGVPSEDPGNLDLLNNLPDDVTLVDLDVGRVILAQSFAYDDKVLRGSDDRAVTAAALRSQVLCLAQALGVLFGSRLQGKTWCSDSATVILGNRPMLSPEATKQPPDIVKLRALCQHFLTELLAGTSSCCYWIEERQIEESEVAAARSDSECTVLFDEDRFFHVKNLRYKGRYLPIQLGRGQYGDEQQKIDVPLKAESDFAVSLDDFDLILEVFLRCQSMSTFISSRPKNRMAYY